MLCLQKHYSKLKHGRIYFCKGICTYFFHYNDFVSQIHLIFFHRTNFWAYLISWTRNYTRKVFFFIGDTHVFLYGLDLINWFVNRTWYNGPMYFLIGATRVWTGDLSDCGYFWQFAQLKLSKKWPSVWGASQNRAENSHNFVKN